MINAPPGPVSAPATLTARLREATSQQHARAEKHPVQQALLRGEADVVAYGSWLRAMRALHGAFEARLTQARSHPQLARAIEDHHFRVQLIDEDLASLAARSPRPGAAPPAADTDSTAPEVPSASGMGPRSRVAWAEIDAMIDADPAVVLGPFYVLEGSTNGGRFIAMALRRALLLPQGAGTRYLDPHGDLVRERWAATKAAMDALPLSSQQHDAIVDAARKTFDLVTTLMDELGHGH